MDRRNRRFGIAVATFAAVVALVAVPSAQASGVAYSSTFNASSEGWFSWDGSSLADATWQASGGNPGGYITGVSDSGFAALQSGSTTWPSANAIGDYGGTLATDIRVNYSSVATETDTTIGFWSGNSSVYACQDLGPTTAAWSTDTATLDASHLDDCSTGRPLTGPQLTAALAYFGGIVVRAGDYESVAATVDVDNAELSAPQAAVTPPTGAIARVLVLGRYRRGKFRGTLTSALDFSCASKMKVTVFRDARRPVKVGTVTTSVPQLWKHTAPTTFTLKLSAAKKGTYYATAAKTKSALDGNTCSAAKSKNVKIS